MSSFVLQRNRKGFIYPALLVLVVFISVMYLVLQLMDKMNGFGEISLGEAQLAVLNAQKEADKATLFLEQAVRVSAVEAFNSLVSSGGFFKPSKPVRDVIKNNLKPVRDVIRNNNVNYFLWNVKNKPQELYLPDAFAVYNDFFKTELNKIVGQKTYDFDPQTFNFFFGNNKIAGFTYKQLEIPISPKEKNGFDAWFAKSKEVWNKDNAIGVYYAQSNFEIEFQDLFEFLETKKLIESVLADCAAKPSPSEFNACIKEESSKVETQLNAKGLVAKVTTNLEDAVFFDITFKKSSQYQKESPVLRMALAKHTVETAPPASVQ